MFEGICCLPKKVLCSSAYNIGGGEMIHVSIPKLKVNEYTFRGGNSAKGGLFLKERVYSPWDQIISIRSLNRRGLVYRKKRKSQKLPPL